MSATLRAELERPIPERILRLPVYRGYPVPFFVEWVTDGHGGDIGVGTPDFRIMSGERHVACVNEQLCWICGERLAAYKSFVLGPMCAVNRTSGEPPSHRECADWAARNCPFLARPHARRRELSEDLGTRDAAGIMLTRNPGVALVWTTKRYRPFKVSNGVLFDIGHPESVSWWAEGREATREEIMASIDSGLPALRKLAEEEGAGAERALDLQLERALRLVPAAGRGRK